MGNLFNENVVAAVRAVLENYEDNNDGAAFYVEKTLTADMSVADIALNSDYTPDDWESGGALGPGGVLPPTEGIAIPGGEEDDDDKDDFDDLGGEEEFGGETTR